MGLKSFTVAVTTAGTKQNLAALVAASLPQISGVLSGAVSLRGSVILLQADPSNTASKFMYIGDAAMNSGSRVGIGCALSPGAFAPGIYIDGTQDVSEYWIDCDSGMTTKNLMGIIVW